MALKSEKGFWDFSSVNMSLWYLSSNNILPQDIDEWTTPRSMIIKITPS